MKNFIYIFIALIILYLKFFHFRTGVTNIKIEKDTIDAGIVRVDSVVIGKFFIENIGNNELVIENFFSDCHCTVVNANKKVVKVGEKLELTVSYKFDIDGFFLQQVYVYGNFENSPQILRFRGVILL
jgi:hypothetical protein